MIKIENVSVVGWEPAIRGARNPMNSWEKSDTLIFDYQLEDTDSSDGFGKLVCHDIFNEEHIIVPEDWAANIDDDVMIGPNDLKLLTNLAKAGSDEAKFRRMIAVYVDITAPMYWWKEADTYKVGTVRNSCSTMHKIHAKEFTIDDFSHEHLFAPMGALPDSKEKRDEQCIIEMWPDQYTSPYGTMMITIKALNTARDLYLKTKDKKYWWQMIQLLPSSYNQRATLMLNYEVLANMYHARKSHKLDEWRDFCKWIETLPYAKELIIGFQMRTDIYNPTILSKYRIIIRHCEEKDGVIELRRNVPDLYLGEGISYAQIRTMVDADSYIKGMAVYSDDIPEGCDVVVNVKDDQWRAFHKLDYKCAFSTCSCHKLRQRFYEDPETGSIKLSPINVISDNIDWSEWEKSFENIAQFLAHPPVMEKIKWYNAMKKDRTVVQ